MDKHYTNHHNLYTKKNKVYYVIPSKYSQYYISDDHDECEDDLGDTCDKKFCGHHLYPDLCQKTCQACPGPVTFTLKLIFLHTLFYGGENA